MTVRIPLNEFQTAVYQLLAKGQSVKIYDRVPNENVQLPYIWLGMMQDTPSESSKDVYTHEITQYFHIFSEQSGKKEMNGIMDDIIYLLSKYELSMPDYAVIDSAIQTVTANGEQYQNGATTYHGIIVYKFTIQERK